MVLKQHKRSQTRRVMSCTIIRWVLGSRCRWAVVGKSNLGRLMTRPVAGKLAIRRLASRQIYSMEELPTTSPLRLKLIWTWQIQGTTFIQNPSTSIGEFSALERVRNKTFSWSRAMAAGQTPRPLITNSAKTNPSPNKSPKPPTIKPVAPASSKEDTETRKRAPI